MRKRIFISLTIFISIVLLNNFFSPIKSIERITDIQLPNFISQVDTYSNLEFYIVAHVKLPNRSILSFSEENGFSSTVPSSQLIAIVGTPVIETPELDDLIPWV